jgi:hypothetical protein
LPLGRSCICAQESDHRQPAGRLRSRDNGPRRRTAEQRDELASVAVDTVIAVNGFFD